MPDRSNPLALAVTGGIDFGSPDAEQAVITKLVQDGLRADADRAGWVERQKALTKLRFAIRPKIKEFPWKGASNLGIPFIDATIRKHKPLLMRLLVEPDPIVEFQGETTEAIEAERQAEEVYNWLFKIHMNAIEPMAYAVDCMEHRGYCFAQVGWDFRTELECRTVSVASLFPQGLPQDPEAIAQTLVQQYDIKITDSRVQNRLQRAVAAIQAGAEWVKLAFKKVVRDRPSLWERDPMQVIMPIRCTDIADAEWVIIQHIMTVRQLETLERDGFFEKGSAAKIREDIGRQEDVRNAGTTGTGTSGQGSMEQETTLQNDRERIWGIENVDNVLVWQIYHWHDFDKDGLADRVETWVHPTSLKRLGSKPYLMPFHRWPLAKFDFEKTNRRWHSPRGISQMLEGLQREINAQHNARIDGMTLRNAPSYQTQVLAGFRARNFRVIPGTVMQLPSGSRLDPLVHDRGPWPEQVNEENLLRNIGEQYIGTIDPTLSGAAGGARTATEVQAAQQTAASTSNLDAILFQLTMREVHEMIWMLWLDLGPEEVFVKVLGPENALPIGKLIKKADIAKGFNLIPTGTIANTNRALELSHAREALQLYLNDESGLVNPFELRRWHLNLLTYRWAKRILNDPSKAQEQVTLRQAAQELTNNPEVQAALTGGINSVPEEQAKRQEAEFIPRNTQRLG